MSNTDACNYKALPVAHLQGGRHWDPKFMLRQRSMETSWLNDLNLTRYAQEGKELQSNEVNLCLSIPVWGCKNEGALKRRNDRYRQILPSVFSQFKNILMTRGKTAKGWNAGSIFCLFWQLFFSCLLSTLWDTSIHLCAHRRAGLKMRCGQARCHVQAGERDCTTDQKKSSLESRV